MRNSGLRGRRGRGSPSPHDRCDPAPRAGRRGLLDGQPPPAFFSGTGVFRSWTWPAEHSPCGLGMAPIGVTFNGEIYNHAELRAELKSRGCEFVTDHSGHGSPPARLSGVGRGVCEPPERDVGVRDLRSRQSRGSSAAGIVLAKSRCIIFMKLAPLPSPATFPRFSSTRIVRAISPRFRSRNTSPTATSRRRVRFLNGFGNSQGAVHLLTTQDRGNSRPGGTGSS